MKDCQFGVSPVNYSDSCRTPKLFPLEIALTRWRGGGGGGGRFNIHNKIIHYAGVGLFKGCFSYVYIVTRVIMQISIKKSSSSQVKILFKTP